MGVLHSLSPKIEKPNVSVSDLLGLPYAVLLDISLKQ